MCLGDTPSGDTSSPSALSRLAPTPLPGEGDNPGAVTANQEPVGTPSVLETIDTKGTDVDEVARANAELRGDRLSAETNQIVADQIAQARGGAGAPEVSDPLGGSPDEEDETIGARQLETAEMSGANYFTRELAVGKSHPPSTTSGKGSLDYTMQRYNLPMDVASSIAFNPGSKYSTGGERGLAGLQIALPGGALLGGMRTLGMMGGRTGSGARPDEGGDNLEPQRPKKVIPRPVAPKTAQGKSTTLASAASARPRFPEGSTVPFPQFRGQSSSIVSPRFRGSLDDEDNFGISRLRLGGVA